VTKDITRGQYLRLVEGSIQKPISPTLHPQDISFHKALNECTTQRSMTTPLCLIQSSLRGVTLFMELLMWVTLDDLLLMDVLGLVLLMPERYMEL